MSPAEREARDMVADRKAQAAATKAYDKADKTPPAPAPKADAFAPKKFAKGGVTRADGCITKGKTKGRIV